MKKTFIGFTVLAVLVAYSLWVRHEQPSISTPSSLTAVNSNSPSTSAPPDNHQSTSSGGGTSGDNSNQSTSGTYKDGSYTGSTEDAYYGNVQVKATISGGKIANVIFLQYPNTHSTSVYINQQAMPYLQQEAIQTQTANVNIVSGATYTSQAFIQSLSNALQQAA